MATGIDAHTLDTYNPATSELLGSVPTTAPDEVQRVVDEVRALQPQWAALSLGERASYLQQTATLLVDQTDAVRDLIAAEQGKPRNEAYSMELLPTIDGLNWIAEQGPKLLADEKIRMHQVFFATKRAHYVYEPVGVMGVIAPWNYPWSIAFGEVALALMAGNGVVLKPASLTPLIGDKIREVFETAGVPEGLIRVIHGPGTGSALVRTTVDKIFFTGSVETGRGVGEQCARMLKGAVLELGGKDPMLVLDDADLNHAVQGALWGGFANAGQSCAGIERVYVHRSIADEFIARVIEGAQNLTLGDPLEWGTEIGPMVDPGQYAIVKDLVDDALANGATLHCGGPAPAPAGLRSTTYYAPAVLTGVRHDMRIMREEIFGPVLPIIVVDSDDEAVALANDSDFGLGASVWTADRARGEAISARLQSGMVWINDHLFSHGAMQTPWGGVKDSGVGRTHSKFGIHECTNVKLRLWEPSLLKDPWWFPYDEPLGLALRQTGALLYGRNGGRVKALRDGAAPLVRVAGRLIRDGVGR